ncbi:NADH:ubiquinone reductase (Na(+)-transporting) subunit F, partial [Mariniphaga sediminis]|uniref:NADH:ubiquinone reductase (Na(+)-transporting) subunit F n=1 Tax=Mariniphaga sediminis TaxID=1628158 RepID=UPI003569A8C3
MKNRQEKIAISGMYPPNKPDYSLTGENAKRAIELGLVEADWYQSPVPRATMRQLLTRKNGPAIRDTLLLILILLSTAVATALLWGTWWVVLPYFIYAVFYGTSSDSRWHECGHGTAFRTDWMNNVVYEAASFMVMRESVVWRWSHTRHHSDTIIVGRDPEIQIPRPPDIKGLVLALVNLGGYKTYYPSLVRHALGKITDAEKTFIPESEFSKIFRNARIILTVYTLVIISAIVLQSWIPIFLVILPNFFGTWLMIIHNTTQHAGLAENVLDHRLNCRTVYMNPISRFIYWNMNYHLEHHMFPLVPYHALPKLHKLIKNDCPPVYTSIYSAWKEILPTLLKQVKDPAYHVKRKLPEPKEQFQKSILKSEVSPDIDGWIEICSTADLDKEDVIRFDHTKKTFAVYRDNVGKFYATDGLCTHGNTHLGDGMVKGNIIECPKHNGRFNLEDGSPARAPICRGLVTYPVEDRAGRLWINISKPGGTGARSEKHYRLRVVNNHNVSTFIKELILEPLDANEKIEFVPGDYLQIEIPEYKEIRYSQFDIPEPYASVWKGQGIFNLRVSNTETGRRNNYSLASNSVKERTLKFNVRIATPPPGQDCRPGIGSSYVFNLKQGDTVSAVGPFGDFHIKPTQKEMVYIGGGAGMAPIRAHIAQLFENDATSRKVSYWYGARSKQEIFYESYFRKLADEHPNFSFQLALSDPLKEDNWTGQTGFIHEVVFENYLKEHSNPMAIEFYLCGPPNMVKACTKMLRKLGVSA